MVYAFMIHGIDPGACRMIFKQLFSVEVAVTTLDNNSHREEDCLQKISFRVQSEYAFRKAGLTVSAVQDTSAERVFTSIESGVFRCSAGNPLDEECHVIWQGLANCGFTFVLSPLENKVLAENVLSLIVRHIIQLCNPVTKPEQIILHPDKVVAILHVFLPMGQLQFMNHKVVKQLEKDLSKIILERR